MNSCNWSAFSSLTIAVVLTLSIRYSLCELQKMRLSIKVAAFMILILSLVVVSMLRTSRTLSQLQGVPNAQQAALAAAETTKNSTRTSFDEVNKNDEYCTPDPHQPVYKVSGRFAEDQLFDTSSAGTRRNEPLVCEYKTDKGLNWFHFPHSMQQLYACYSFYQQPRDEEGNRPKFLLMSSSAKSQLDENMFLKGYFQLLQNEMGVKILNQTSFHEIYDREEGVNVSSAAFYNFHGYMISHVQELNELAHNYIFKIKEMTTSSTSSVERPICGMKDRDDDSPAAVLFPRIGILNRIPRVGRSIRNVRQLMDTIANISFHQQVELEYFEGASFVEQVQFFQRTDILISPHGAQLAGLPFLAKTKCSQLLEIFPHKYLIPTFFGSLARNSDIGYSYLYLSDQAANFSLANTFWERKKARKVNLCAPMDVIRKSIERLVGDWRECCQRAME